MSEQQTTKKVLYKGIMVPARELKIGEGKVKLVPIKTDRYTLYGIPMPSNFNLTEEIQETAREIIAHNKHRTRDNNEAPILIKYIRKGQDGYVLASSVTDKDTREYFVAKGEPYGAMVAFLHKGNLRIGWSKRLKGKKLAYGKVVQREPLSFTKKDAIKIAVIRGLVDSLTFYGSNVLTVENNVIPKAIVKALPAFIEHVEKYFKCDVANIYQHPSTDQSDQSDQSDVEKECPPFNEDVGVS